MLTQAQDYMFQVQPSYNRRKDSEGIVGEAKKHSSLVQSPIEVNGREEYSNNLRHDLQPELLLKRQYSDYNESEASQIALPIKNGKVDLFKYFKQQAESTNPPRLVSFKRKVSSSKYKGVLYVKSQSKWRAQVCLGGKKKYIGSYDTEIDAAVARDKKIRQLFGDKIELLNFPNERDTILQQKNYSTSPIANYGVSKVVKGRKEISAHTQVPYSHFPMSAFAPLPQLPGYGQQLQTDFGFIDDFQLRFDNIEADNSPILPPFIHHSWFDKWKAPQYDIVSKEKDRFKKLKSSSFDVENLNVKEKETNV